MNIIVGSLNKRKVAITRKVFSSYFKEEFQVLPFNAVSGVPETPWGSETYSGARNRAIHCKSEFLNGSFFVGLESGLIERYGHVFEEAWACVLTKHGGEYYGYSSGLKVPEYILKKMVKDKLSHADVMIHLENELYLSEGDTWGNYSGNLITRDISLEESLRNSLIQLVADDKSFYQKKIN